MSDPTPIPRAALEGISGAAYLYTGAEGPTLVAHRDAALRYLADKSAGDEGRQRAEGELERSRAGAAALLLGDPSNVALLGNASDAISRLVNALSYAPGDRVVTTELEFPSGIQSLLALRSRGVEVEIVPSRDGDVDDERVLAAIDGRTRLVLASHTSFVSGARVDAPALHAAANAVGAAFVLDATQSLGVLPVRADDADAVVSSTYKWLLGPHGLGIVHLGDETLFPGLARAVGWRSVDDVFVADRFESYDLRDGARRLELGFPSFVSAYLLAESLALLETVDAAALEEHVVRLVSSLADGLAQSGARLLSPADPARRGANLSVAAEDAGVLADRLRGAGVRVWGGDGRLRFSVHGFVTEDDIALAVDAYRRCT